MALEETWFENLLLLLCTGSKWNMSYLSSVDFVDFSTWERACLQSLIFEALVFILHFGGPSLIKITPGFINCMINFSVVEPLNCQVQVKLCHTNSFTAASKGHFNSTPDTLLQTSYSECSSTSSIVAFLDTAALTTNYSFSNPFQHFPLWLHFSQHPFWHLLLNLNILPPASCLQLFFAVFSVFWATGNV